MVLGTDALSQVPPACHNVPCEAEYAWGTDPRSGSTSFRVLVHRHCFRSIAAEAFKTIYNAQLAQSVVPNNDHSYEML